MKAINLHSVLLISGLNGRTRRAGHLSLGQAAPSDQSLVTQHLVEILKSC